MEIEFESSQPIKFAKAFMYDGDGNVALCKCVKPACSGAMGKEAYILWCEHCSPYKESFVAKFVYKPPNVPN